MRIEGGRIWAVDIMLLLLFNVLFLNRGGKRLQRQILDSSTGLKRQQSL